MNSLAPGVASLLMEYVPTQSLARFPSLRSLTVTRFPIHAGGLVYQFMG